MQQTRLSPTRKVEDAGAPDAVFLDDLQTSAQLNIAARTLRRWRREGKGPPFFKLGSLIRYHRDRNIEWALEQQRSSTRG